MLYEICQTWNTTYGGESKSMAVCVTMRITANGALAGDGNILNLNYGMAAWLYRFTKHHQTVHFFQQQIIQYWILYHNKVAKTVLENQSPYLDILSKSTLCGTLPLWDIDLILLVESISSLVIDPIFNLTHRKENIIFPSLLCALEKNLCKQVTARINANKWWTIFSERLLKTAPLFTFYPLLYPSLDINSHPGM